MDRNSTAITTITILLVALRKESVDRNLILRMSMPLLGYVALRKESVDRNARKIRLVAPDISSLSARRAWIEIRVSCLNPVSYQVALRKESVDRNKRLFGIHEEKEWSLSARRAWIEMVRDITGTSEGHGRSPQGERG